MRKEVSFGFSRIKDKYLQEEWNKVGFLQDKLSIFLGGME